MKKSTSKIFPFLILLAAFITIRFGLFQLHGMKQWPTLLALASLIVIVISSFMDKGRKLVAFTLLGYFGGFFLATLLHSTSLDPGGGLQDNRWIIWTTFFLICLVLGFVSVIKNNEGLKDES